MLIVSILGVLLPSAALVLLGSYVLRTINAFLPEDQAARLRVMTRVASYVVAIAYVAVYTLAVLSMNPAQDASLSLPPSYLLIPAIVLRSVLLGLAWCFALIVAGMSIVMSLNYLRVASGRRRAVALWFDSLGSIVMALGLTVGMEGKSFPFNIMHVVSLGLYASAWAVRRA